MSEHVWDSHRLGAYIREHREGMDGKPSLRHIAQVAGLAPGHLSQLERGGIPEPKIVTVVKIAQALGIAPLTLFEVYNPGVDWTDSPTKLPVLGTPTTPEDP